MAAVNNWPNRIRRTFTAVLPVARNRRGKCMNCGECCKLPNVCPFLKYGKDGQTKCIIYFFRVLNCRKYPRCEKEWITKESCGYRFE